MSKTLCGSVTSRRPVAVLMAALFGLTLALNPIAAPPANAVSVDAARAAVAVRALRVTAAQVGIPYLWGGTTPRGFDCSGLSQYAYARVGKSLPRTAMQQYKATIRVKRGNQRAGDLIFLYSNGNVYHMGVYSGNGYFWHAPRTGSLVKKSRIWTTRYLIGRVR